MPASSRPGAILNLLVVDDDRETRMALRQYLEAAAKGIAIELASYGAEAMRKMESAPVDVLLTDDDMPGMRGTQLVAWARQRHPEVRCLVMSAEVDEGFQQQSAALGIRVFRKPFTDRDLVALVDALRT